MPLRDHFHPPLSQLTSWDGFHAAWPTMIVQQLNASLPARFVAAPFIHLGSAIEIDVATFDQPEDRLKTEIQDNGSWQLGEPSMVVETELMEEDTYEVQVFDEKHHRRLVAAIEIVSPSNKDRPESRQTFVAKCEALLKRGVCVILLDVVTDKHFNLYTELLELIEQTDPQFLPEPPAISAASCRWIPRGRKHVLETWSYALHLGKALPTLPLWLAEDFAFPLDIESSYEQTCQILRIL